MLSTDPYPGRKYEFAEDRDTGELVVLKLQDDAIDQGAVFYDPARHTHLTCFGCKTPDIKVIEPFSQSGGKKIGRHFKIAHGQKHTDDCSIETVVVDPEHTLRDETKGPVIFLNPSWQDLTSHFKKAAEGHPAVDHLLYVDEKGKQRIRNDDLEPRPRLQARDMEGMLAVMTGKKMTQDLLNDSWIIRGDTATPWPKFFIRGASRWTDMAQDMIGDDHESHPVMIHARMTRAARYEIHNDKPRLLINLPPFEVQDRRSGDTVVIHPHLYIRDQKLFGEFTKFKKGETRELLIIATPYQSEKPQREKNAPNLRFVSDAEAARPDAYGPRHVHIHFDINPRLYVQQNLQELSRKMTERPSFTAPASGNDNPTPA